MTRSAPPLSPPSPRPVPGAALPLLVVAAALACRAPALSGAFVNYDDGEVYAAAGSSPWAILTGPFYAAYKPVYGLSMWLDRALFGPDPLGWHAGNWLLYGAAAGLACVLVRAATGSSFLGAAAGLWLATHPVHTENVAWVAERKDALSLVLVLLAHLAHRRGRVRAPSRPSALAAALFAAAGLAKGTVWTWAGVVALDEATTRDRPRGALARLAPWAAIAVGGIALDAWVGAAAGPGSVRHDASFPALAASMAAVHARYLISLVWPVGLSVDYAVDPAGTWASALAVAGVLAAAAALVGLVVGVRRRAPVLALGCGLWVLGLAPVNNLWPTTSTLRADRYLLVPALGAYLLLAAALGRALGRRGGARWAAVVGAAGLLAVLAAARARVWADSETLWTDAIEAQPASAVARTNRALDRQERAARLEGAGRHAEAAPLWEGCLADALEGVRLAGALRRPEIEHRARRVAVRALLQRGRVEEARRAALDLVEAADRLPQVSWVAGDTAAARAEARVDLGHVQRAHGDLEAAVRAYRAAADLDPRQAEAWKGLGLTLAPLGGEARVREAADALGRAVALEPDDLDAVAYLVRVLYRLGRDAEAGALLAATNRRLGSPRALRKAEAKLAADAGEPEVAEARLRELLAEDPGDLEVRSWLAGLLRREGAAHLVEARTSRDASRASRALEAFERAAEAWPQDAEAQVGAGDALLALSRFGDARERYRRARVLAPGAAWIANLEARAGTLAAGWLAHLGQADEAARAFGAVVGARPSRVDLGYAALEAETAWLEPAVESLETAREGPERRLAVACLSGAASLVAGDEDRARDALADGLRLVGEPPPPATRLGRLHDAARLLLAVVRARRTDVAGARHELEPVAARRPDDPVVAYHLLLLDRMEAAARGRIAHGTADAEAEAAARAAEDGVLARADALAGKGPGWPGPGLLAVEIEISHGDHLEALRRSSALAERFPDSPGVLRATAAVYQAQALGGGDRSALLGEAQRALLGARDLDPRDPRTSLDLSQLYRLLGDLDAALRHGLAAASVEPLPGPASRAVAAILVEKGRRALEGRDVPRALAWAASAAKADPGSPAPDLLAGDAWTARQDLKEALAAFRAAREKAPADPATAAALAGCLRQRGNAYFLWRQRYPRPQARDGKEPDAAAVVEWDEKNLMALRQAVREFEEALRLDPGHPDAERVREHVARLRAQDPEAVAADASEAKRSYDEGERLRREQQFVEALEAYREAVRRWPEHLPAWMRIAETAVALGGDYDVEGLVAVDRVRALDTDRAYAEPDLYAGEIWARRWQAQARTPGEEEAAAVAARRARASLERFLAAADVATERGRSSAARARRLLEGLPQER